MDSQTSCPILNWHVSANEPFTVSNHFPCSCGHRVKMNDAALLFCQQGCSDIKVDINKYSLQSNTIVVLQPGHVVCLSEESSDFNMLFIGFSYRLFADVTFHIPYELLCRLKQHPCIQFDNKSTLLINLLFALGDKLYADCGHRFRIQIIRNCLQSFFLDLYSVVFPKLKPVDATSRQEEIFREFASLVQKYGDKQHEVAFYADKMCISPRYLSTVIHSVNGSTAKAIIEQHVIMEMKILLHTTSLNVSEIADRFCFPNQSYLGKFFKKHVGMSPLAFRKRGVT